MNKMCGFEKWLNMAEWVFRLLFFTYTMLSFNSLCYGQKVISLVLWPSVLVGMFVLVGRALFYKKYIRMPGIIFLAMFLLSFVVSAITNIRYGYTENMIKFVFLLFFFFILFTKDEKISADTMKRETRIMGWYLEVYMFVCALISFGFMVAGYTTVRTIEDGWDIGIGFLWGRLWGVFTEPNYASVFATVCIAMAMYFFRTEKRKFVRVFAIVNIVVQIFYIAFTDSRTGQVVLGVTMTILVFNYLNYRRIHKTGKKSVKMYLLILVTAATFLVSFNVPTLITETYNIGVSVFDPEEPERAVDRGYDLSADPTNRRFDIWRSGLEVFASTPVVGTSYSNILPYTLDNFEDTYLINNSAEKNFSSIHNEILNVLVGQGVFGVAVLFAFIGYAVSWYIKFYFKEMNEDQELFNNMLISSIAGITAGAMTLTGMFYSNAPTVILFWMFLGYFLINMKRKKEGK